MSPLAAIVVVVAAKAAWGELLEGWWEPEGELDSESALNGFTGTMEFSSMSLRIAWKSVRIPSDFHPERCYLHRNPSGFHEIEMGFLRIRMQFGENSMGIHPGEQGNHLFFDVCTSTLARERKCLYVHPKMNDFPCPHA